MGRAFLLLHQGESFDTAVRLMFQTRPNQIRFLPKVVRTHETSRGIVRDKGRRERGTGVKENHIMTPAVS